MFQKRRSQHQFANGLRIALIEKFSRYTAEEHTLNAKDSKVSGKKLLAGNKKTVAKAPHV